MNALPPSLRGRADVAGNGELLWPGEAAPDAVAWMAGEHLGIVTVELYARVDPARGVFQQEWPVTPRWRPDEPWEAYVERAAAHAIVTIERATRERSAAPDVRAGDLRYFIAVSTREDMPRRGGWRSRGTIR